MFRSMLAAPFAALALVASASAQSPYLAPPTDPVKLDLARQLIAASGGEKGAEDRLKAIFQTTDQIIAAGSRPEIAKLTERFQADMRVELLADVPQLMDASARAYAKVLSEQELRDYLAWLRSDSGKAIAAKGIQIQQVALATEMPLLTKLMSGSIQKALDRTCQEEGCTPDQRRTLVAMMSKAFPALAKGQGGG